MRRLRHGIVLVAASTLVLAGCTSGDSGPSANGVVIGIPEPKHLIPTNTTDPSGAQVLSSLFYPLVSFDADRNPVPAAAVSIKPDATDTVWTVALKPGLTFSNGEPVIADNYLDAWNYGAHGLHDQAAAYLFAPIDGYADLQSVDPDGPAGPQPAPAPKAETLSGLKKVDDTTFTVTLSAPFAGWDAVLGATAFYPLPKAAFSTPGVLAKGFEDKIVGDGPFTLDGSWEHGKQIKVRRADGFKGPAPKVADITWKIYDRPDAAFDDLNSGDLDVQPQLPADQLDQARKALGDRYRTSPNSSFTYLGLPAYQPEYANPKVRRALSMAIDRKAMTDQIFLGSQVPATAFVAPVVPGYRAGSCGTGCQYDPAAARKLYEANKGPRSVQITYNTDGRNKAWADLTCEQIHSSLGVDCAAVGVPTFADLLAKVDRREPVGMIRAGWVMDYPLMEDYLRPLYATGGLANHYGYSNPAFDGLLRKASEGPGRPAAVTAWQQAEDALAQDMPIIPLRFGLNVYGYSKRVSDVQVDAFERVDVYTIRVNR